MTTKYVESNQTVTGVLAAVRRAVEREFSHVRAEQPQFLHLALNEAEALAAQTEFPHLVFPTLAEEKAEAVAHWLQRQKMIQLAPAFALAA